MEYHEYDRKRQNTRSIHVKVALSRATTCRRVSLLSPITIILKAHLLLPVHKYCCAPCENTVTRTVAGESSNIGTVVLCSYTSALAVTKHLFRRQSWSSNLLVESCVFEECFAAKKGGAIQHSIGGVTVANSTFWKNSAGSGNEYDSEQHPADRSIGRLEDNSYLQHAEIHLTK